LTDGIYVWVKREAIGRHVVGLGESDIARKCDWMREMRMNCLEWF
jgi:hypothetical protein